VKVGEDGDMASIVSIILTSYNKPETIGQSIESVINQTFQDWELFIMDDNSNEQTRQIINRYLNDPRIHFFNSNIHDSERHKTTRYATLINEAIPKTCGKYITYLTDDNMFLPERLEKMVYYLQQNQTIDIVYSRQLVRWIDETTGVQREVVRNTRGILRNAAGIVDHCSVMHTRKIADQIFNEYGSYWDDNPDFWNYGDAIFWSRLNKYKPFYPIRKVLDIAFKGPDSFQRLYTHMPTTIPDGTLVRGLSSDIYLIDKQKRRKIHPHIFVELKYPSNLVVKIPDPFLFKYNEGYPIDDRVFENFALFPNQRLIKSSSNDSVYYIQNNKKHHIINEKAFNDYKFQTKQIVLVSSSLLDQIPEGPPIEELSPQINILPDGFLFKCQNDFYICFNNQFHQIEQNVAVKLNLPVSNPVSIDHTFLSRYKQGEPFVWKN
jgi:spore maturation protein CgeD